MIVPSEEAMLQARQNNNNDFDDDDVHWWYSDTGRIVKWSVFLGLVVLLAAYIIGGYLHARARLRKGQLPLAYHRWLVRRSDLARVDPSYAYPVRPMGPGPYGARPGWTTHRPADAYHMQDMGAPPPPVYDPSSQRPPMYSPPEGGSKVNPSQAWQAPPPPPQGDYAPPSGPPPGQGIAPQGTGNTNPFR